MVFWLVTIFQYLSVLVKDSLTSLLEYWLSKGLQLEKSFNSPSPNSKSNPHTTALSEICYEGQGRSSFEPMRHRTLTPLPFTIEQRVTYWCSFYAVCSLRGRDSAYKRGGDARRKFWIKPLKETDLGATQAFFLIPKRNHVKTQTTYIFLYFFACNPKRDLHD